MSSRNKRRRFRLSFRDAPALRVPFSSPGLFQSNLMPAPEQLTVSSLGARQFKSPLSLSTKPGDDLCDFTPDTARLLYRADFVSPNDVRLDLSFERRGLVNIFSSNRPRQWLRS